MRALTNTVDRLRVRGAAQDDAVLRLSLSRELEQALEAPSALPPSSVLLIRALGDPQPGALGSNDRQRRLAWAGALRQRLDRSLSRAVRPDGRGIVPDGKAVLFTEQAELLAAVAASIARGGPQPWWCRSLLRRLGGVASRRVASVIGMKPELAPGICDCLARWHRLDDAVGLLTDAEASNLTGSLIAAFDLDHLATALTQATAWRHATFAEREVDTAVQPEDPGLWPRDWIPPPHRRSRTGALIGLALTLHRSPVRARSERFARRCALQMSANATSGRAIAGARRDRGATKTTALDQDSKPAAIIPLPGIGSDRPAADRPRPTRGKPAARSSRTKTDHGADAARACAPDETVSDDLDYEPVPMPANADWPVVGGEAATDTEQTPAIVTAPGAGVPTLWGGALFLVQLLDRLEIPGCFEPDWRLARQAGPWTLLALLAQSLLGKRAAGDGLWAVLTALDGPDAPDPASERLGKPDYCIPSAWLADVDDAVAPRRAVRNGRVTVWRPGEFVLYEGMSPAPLPHTERARETARDAFATLPRALAEQTLQPSPSPGLKRWLWLVVPFLARRLTDLGGAPAADLLRCPGRVYLDRTHLDLVAGLDAIRLGVRRAGLDRDPGWRPRYGRVIQFHFR